MGGAARAILPSSLSCRGARALRGGVFAALCCWAVAAPGLASATPGGTEIAQGPNAAPFTLVMYGDLGCPLDSPDLGAWWPALQAPEVASRVRLVYRHAPSRRTKNTLLATQAALAAGEQGPRPFFEMAARICALVRTEGNARITKKRVTKEAAQVAFNQKKFRRDFRRLKKRVREQVDTDVQLGIRSRQGSGGQTTSFLVNGDPVDFANPADFLAWLASQENPQDEPQRTSEALTARVDELPVLQVAVYEISSPPASSDVVFVVRDALTSELRKLEKVSVISMDEVRIMLSYEADKQTIGCDDDSCLTEIAAALGVDVVVTGGLSVVGEKSYMTLKRMDQKQGNVAQQYSATLDPAGGEEFLAALGPAVAELFPERGLRPGQTRGVDTSLVSRLNPPPLPPALFWTGAALSGTALALSTFAGATLVSEYLAFDALRSGQKGTPIDGGRLGTLRASVVGWQDATRAALGTTGALVALTGVAAAFTNWEGEAADAARSQP